MSQCKVTHIIIPLPVKLQNSAKGLIHLQYKDDECFRWCHIQYLNPQERNPQRIKKTVIEMVQELKRNESVLTWEKGIAGLFDNP